MKEEQKKIEEQIVEYMEQIEIPDELDQYVKKGIEIGQLQQERMKTMRRWMKGFTTSVAVMGIAFVGTANLSPTFAQTMSEIPVLKSLVKVVTFGQYEYKEKNYEANIETPIIEGLENQALQHQLNEKYIEENKKLFEEFQADKAEIESLGGKGHLGTDAGFEVKTDNETILSVGRYVVNTAASSSTMMEYDTIDKKNEILITLPSLFKDDTYIETISEYVRAQMKQQMTKDENKIYWVEDEEGMIEGFKGIQPEQDFYITDQGKLVISFNEYEVAPGYMGIVEFEIPTELLKEILVSDAYIK